jgi:hypothetical protein
MKPGSVEIQHVTIGGRPRDNFIPDRFQIALEPGDLGEEVVVTFRAKRD